MRKKLVLACTALVLSFNSFAGEIVKDTEITRIGSSSKGVTDDFFITVSRGTGSCAGGHIVFRRADAPSDAFFDRLYALAMLAFANKSQKVRVVSPNDSCNTATYLEVSR